MLALHCYDIDAALACQALLVAPPGSRSDLAIGPLQEVVIEWRDLSRQGQFRGVALLRAKSQVLQSTPRVEPGGFWILRAKEPVPFVFQVSTTDACQLQKDIEAFRQRVKPMEGRKTQPVEVKVSVRWSPGFALAERSDAALSKPDASASPGDQNFDELLARLCNGNAKKE